MSRGSRSTSPTGSIPVITGTPSGDLVDPTRPVSGVRAVSFSASDQGGGVYVARVEIDGQAMAVAIVDDNGGRCVKPFRYPVPCRSTASGTLTVDTARAGRRSRTRCGWW